MLDIIVEWLLVKLYGHQAKRVKDNSYIPQSVKQQVDPNTLKREQEALAKEQRAKEGIKDRVRYTSTSLF